jgi:hypothetical protein
MPAPSLSDTVEIVAEHSRTDGDCRQSSNAVCSVGDGGLGRNTSLIGGHGAQCKLQPPRFVFHSDPVQFADQFRPFLRCFVRGTQTIVAYWLHERSPISFLVVPIFRCHVACPAKLEAFRGFHGTQQQHQIGALLAGSAAYSRPPVTGQRACHFLCNLLTVVHYLSPVLSSHLHALRRELLVGF